MIFLHLREKQQSPRKRARFAPLYKVYKLTNYWHFIISVKGPVFPVYDLKSYSEYYWLVFTKSVNRNFRAFWFVPVTRNILGYSLFCDCSQDGVSFQDIFVTQYSSDKWSSRTNKYQKRVELRLFAVYMLNLPENRKIHLTNSPKCL